MQKDAKIQVCFCSKEFMRADRNFPKRPNAFFFNIFHYHVQEHSGYQLDEQQTKKQELLSETHLRQNRVRNQGLVVTTAQAGLSPTCTPNSTTRAGSPRASAAKERQENRSGAQGSKKTRPYSSELHQSAGTLQQVSKQVWGPGCSLNGAHGRGGGTPGGADGGAQVGQPRMIGSQEHHAH